MGLLIFLFLKKKSEVVTILKDIYCSILQPNIYELTFGYLSVLVIFFLLTVFRIVSGAGIYTKVKYILVLLVSLGILFIEVNINYLLPIFYTLELGTALFLVMVMKSCINLWNEQGNII
jgi:hypothetical protein